MSKKKIEEIAIDAYTNHNSKFEDLKKKWVELTKRYENELREESITAETQGKVRLGAAFALVENFVSRVMSQSPRFHYLPRERNDVEFVEQYSEFNEYQHDIARSKEAFEMIAKWAAITGLSGFKMGWKVEEILHKVRGKEVMGKRITNPALVEMMDKVKVGRSIKVDDSETISNWTIDVIKPFDLVWSIEATEREDAFVLGHVIHNKKYKQLRHEGYDLRKLSHTIRKSKNYWEEQLDIYKEESATKILDDMDIEIVELHVKWQNASGVYEQWVITLGNINDTKYTGTPVSIRCEKNQLDKQFVPIGLFRPIKRPGKMYGYGIIEPVEKILDAEEDTLNMVTEAFWTDVARPMEYVPNNIIDEDSLEYKPRTLVPVRKLGESLNVMPAPRVDFGGTSYIQGFLEKSKQNVSAITDYQTGADQRATSQTATEIRTKTFLSEKRSNKILQRFETEVLEVAGKWALWLNKQYLSEDKKIIYRVLGKKGKMMEKNMSLKAVEAIKDVVIASGSSAYVDSSAEIAKWSELYQIALTEAQMGQMGVPMDREYILNKIVEKGYQVKDPENLIPSLKEREEELVQAKKADLKQAKKENHDPSSARVMPNDSHQEIHIPVHQAALQAQGMTDDAGKFTKYSAVQLQTLTEHLNEHARLAGGSVPSFAQGAEGATQQAMMQGQQQQAQPQQAQPQPQQTQQQ